MTAKLPALTDGQGQIIRFLIRPGNVAAAKELPTLLAGVPLRETRELLGDKAYDRNRVRDGLADRDIAATIPSEANRKEPIRFDQWSYQGRPLVENACSDLKQFRCLACRYAKRADSYAGMVRLVAWFLRTKGRQRPASQYHQATAAA